jgi:2-(1,2-epoxy-1,2-dihydrophenyl)acetyl-CoA isomerase
MLTKTRQAVPAVVSSLYAAFAARDIDGLTAALHPAFDGHVSEAMPLGVGGAHAGPAAMIDVWLRVFRDYDITPVPTEIRSHDDGTVVVHGWYRGTHRATGGDIAAEFVHLLTVDDGRVRSLRQITDTAAWAPRSSAED